MDYITKLYKHRAEQLQEQIFILEKQLNLLTEAPAMGSGRSAIYPGSMPSIMNQLDAKENELNWMPMRAGDRPPQASKKGGLNAANQNMMNNLFANDTVQSKMDDPTSMYNAGSDYVRQTPSAPAPTAKAPPSTPFFRRAGETDEEVAEYQQQQSQDDTMARAKALEARFSERLRQQGVPDPAKQNTTTTQSSSFDFTKAGRGTAENPVAQMAGGVTKALDDVRRGMPSVASDNRTLSYIPKSGSAPSTQSQSSPQSSGANYGAFGMRGQSPDEIDEINAQNNKVSGSGYQQGAGINAVANLGRGNQSSSSQISQSAADWNQTAMEPGGVYKVDKSGYVQSYLPAGPKSSAPAYDFNKSSGDLVNKAANLLGKFGTTGTPASQSAPAPTPPSVQPQYGPVSGGMKSQTDNQNRITATDNPLVSTYTPTYIAPPGPKQAPGVVKIKGRDSEWARKQVEKEAGFNPVRTKPLGAVTTDDSFTGSLPDFVSNAGKWIGNNIGDITNLFK
jgi:hypothetical protein